MEVSYTKFHQNLILNVKNMQRNSVMPQSKVWLTEPIFTKFRLVPQLFVKKNYIENFMKVWQMIQSLILGQRQTHGLCSLIWLPTVQGKNIFSVSCVTYYSWAMLFDTVHSSQLLCMASPSVCTCCYNMVSITNIIMYHTICVRPPSLVHTDFLGKVAAAWSWSLASI